MMESPELLQDEGAIRSPNIADPETSGPGRTTKVLPFDQTVETVIQDFPSPEEAPADFVDRFDDSGG